MNPNELNLNIRPEDLLDVKCDNCGGKYFEQVVQMKKISSTHSNKDFWMNGVFQPILVWMMLQKNYGKR